MSSSSRWPPPFTTSWTMGGASVVLWSGSDAKCGAAFPATTESAARSASRSKVFVESDTAARFWRRFFLQLSHSPAGPASPPHAHFRCSRRPRQATAGAAVAIARRVEVGALMLSLEQRVPVSQLLGQQDKLRALRGHDVRHLLDQRRGQKARLFDRGLQREEVVAQSRRVARTGRPRGLLRLRVAAYFEVLSDAGLHALVTLGNAGDRETFLLCRQGRRCR